MMECPRCSGQVHKRTEIDIHLGIITEWVCWQCGRSVTPIARQNVIDVMKATVPPKGGNFGYQGGHSGKESDRG